MEQKKNHDAVAVKHVVRSHGGSGAGTGKFWAFHSKENRWTELICSVRVHLNWKMGMTPEVKGTTRIQFVTQLVSHIDARAIGRTKCLKPPTGLTTSPAVCVSLNRFAAHCHSENGNGNVTCNAKSVAFLKRYPVMLTLSSVTTKRILCIFTIMLQCKVICLAIVM